jgi:hypothetical protein
MRAYVLQATKLKNGGFHRFVKTGNWVSFFAQALKKLEGFFRARMWKISNEFFQIPPPSKS